MKFIDIKKNFFRRFMFERSLRKNGYSLIAGIDEVGRGCIAGPVVACAVILKTQFNLKGCFDSKQLTKLQRKKIEPLIKLQILDFAFGSVSSKKIDKINIYNASKEAMGKAVLNLKLVPDFLLVDAMSIETSIKQKKIIHGDQLSNSVAAASILAKQYRDRLMSIYNKLYPGYFFNRNKGYLTEKHKRALFQKGASPIHRLSFNPIRKNAHFF